jgi:hypothetical protein
MSGGTLVAHPPARPAHRRRPARARRRHPRRAACAAAAAAVLPAPLARRPSLRHLALFSRRPVETEAFAEAVADGLAVDVFLGIGETAVARALKDGGGAIMLGPDTHTSGSGQSPVLVESRVGPEGRLALRGAMVPRSAFPPGAENGVPPFWSVDEEGFRDTGLPAAADKARKSRLHRVARAGRRLDRRPPLRREPRSAPPTPRPAARSRRSSGPTRCSATGCPASSATAAPLPASPAACWRPA